MCVLVLLSHAVFVEWSIIVVVHNTSATYIKPHHYMVISTVFTIVILLHVRGHKPTKHERKLPFWVMCSGGSDSEFFMFGYDFAD